MKWPLHRKPKKPEKKIELVRATVFELKPDTKYVIAVDANYLTPAERQALSRILVNKGVKNITLIGGKGDPTKSVVVMEQAS